LIPHDLGKPRAERIPTRVACAGQQPFRLPCLRRQVAKGAPDDSFFDADSLAEGFQRLACQRIEVENLAADRKRELLANPSYSRS